MSEKHYRWRRIAAGLVVLIISLVAIVGSSDMWQVTQSVDSNSIPSGASASKGLQQLSVKSRQPKTGYQRTFFGDGWRITNGCDTRSIILYRDLNQVTVGDNCRVLSGTLNDPYTAKVLFYKRSPGGADIQIDHVVALSDAWQKGGKLLSKQRRIEFANDPLELLAVDGPANQQKGDGDAATWLPPNKSFRCQYVARQIAIKLKYELWVTAAEHEAMRKVLSRCPNQDLPLSRS